MLQAARSPRLGKLLSEQGRLLHFKKGQVVFSTDFRSDGIVLMAEGYIKRYLITNSGALGVQIVYGPKDVFSLTKVYSALLGQSLYDGPETFHYKTMTSAKLYMLDIDIFTKAVHEDPLIYKDLFSEAGQHLKTCVHSLENIALMGAYARVAHELLFWANRFGKDTSSGTQLILPLTQRDIAEILALARETVSKAIAKLRENGIINGDRNIVILNLQALEEAAYG